MKIKKKINLLSTFHVVVESDINKTDTQSQLVNLLAVFFGASQVALVVKDLPATAGDRRHQFDPWVWKIPWRRKWQPTPGQRSEEPGRLQSMGSQRVRLKQFST